MYSVCWNITNKCNKKCKYCFRDINENELPLEKNVEILDQLIQSGIEKITWSGGEPTEYKGIEQLLKISKENGIYNKMVTNASNLNDEFSRNIINYIDELTFSIDSTDDTLNEELGRGKNYFKNLVIIIEKIKKEFPRCKISVNTVVMRQNMNLINEVYNEIVKLGVIKWKLLQFSSFRGIAIKNKEMFAITNDEYNKILNIYKSKENNFKICGHTAEQLEKTHIIVTSSGIIEGE